MSTRRRDRRTVPPVEHGEIADHDEGRGDVEGTVARLRHERDELAARVAALEGRRTDRARVRHVAVALLVVVGTIGFTLSAVGWWARRNVADTGVWVTRVRTLPEDPAVRAAFSTWLTDETVELVDLDGLLAEVLPERGRLLVAPLSEAVEGFVRQRVDRFVASDTFQRLWVAVNERAHREVVRVLRGDDEVVRAGDDRVVVNLVPVIDAVLADIGRASPDLLGRRVDLPELSVDDLPDTAIARLERALGIDLGDDFGQVVIYDRGRLRALQDGLERARRGLVALSVLTVVAFGAALGLSRWRRRTLLQVLAGLALGLALVRRLGLRSQRELLAGIPDELNRAAAEAVSDRFLGPLLDVTRTLLLGLAALAVVVVLTGPYPWVVSLRRHAAAAARGIGPALTRTAQSARTARPAPAGPGDPTDPAAVGGPVDPGFPADWVRRHGTALRVGGVGAVVAVLLVADLSFAGLVVLAGLAALGGLALHRLAAVAPDDPDDPGGAGRGDDPDGDVVRARPGSSLDAARHAH